MCDEELDKNHPEKILSILMFERALIKKSDAGCYTYAEALKEIVNSELYDIRVWP